MKKMGVKKDPSINLKDMLLQILPYDQDFTSSGIKRSLEEKGIVCGQDYSESNLSSILHQLRATGIIKSGKRRTYRRMK